MKKILVTGAFGLVGSDLTLALQQKYGQGQVIALGHNKSSGFKGPTQIGDVRDKFFLRQLIQQEDVGQIYHLAGLLSAGGEKNPELAWDVNVNGLKNVLDLAAEFNLRLFWPSSIAVFGPTTPKEQTPQQTVLEPTTIYGVTKVTGELLCQYYHQRYGVDVRSLRYPGLIGYKMLPGDGTTEYAISIFYAALKKESYRCFLGADTTLPMMYMADAIRGTLELMAAPKEAITIRTGYNFSSVSFSPQDIYQEIVKHLPDFKIEYQPDSRQQNADSWPHSIDDDRARKDWHWQPQYQLPEMVLDMLNNLK